MFASDYCLYYLAKLLSDLVEDNSHLESFTRVKVVKTNLKANPRVEVRVGSQFASSATLRRGIELSWRTGLVV